MSVRIVYGLQEIQLVLQIFGESSSIYRAMVMGIPISNIVRVKMNENIDKKDQLAELLQLCVNRENVFKDIDMCQ